MVSDILHVTAASLINIYAYTEKDAYIIYDKHRTVWCIPYDQNCI
jgi:hypothetical protein